MLMYIALDEVLSPPTTQKLQSNAYMRASLCVPGVISAASKCPFKAVPCHPIAPKWNSQTIAFG
jgi:hypothetical protein